MVCTDAELAAVDQLIGNSTVAQAICSTYNVSRLGTNAAVMQYTLSELAATKTKLAVTQREVAGANYGLDTMFVLVSAYQVFMMQAGFALFAAGVVRSKNVFNILLKNIIDAAIAAITFYCIGYALAYGKGSTANGFIGTSNFALSDMRDEATPDWHNFVWNWAFSAAAATIVSGAVAERATFISYLCYSIFISTWVYPVVVHWVWSPHGWLSAKNSNRLGGIGAIDFAGCGVVHCVGGFASLVGATIIGPRIGRFDPAVSFSSFRVSSAAHFVLGTFLLWFGWYGFNPGSVLHINTVQYASTVGRVAVVTTLGGGAGGVVAGLISYWRSSTWDLLQICSGLLAGLVSVTAGCSVIEPWAGIIGGAIGGAIMTYGEEAVQKLKIDDPVGATAMHAGCGLWGLLLVGLLGHNKFIREVYGQEISHDKAGIFYGGDGTLLGMQLLAMVVVPAWVMLNVAALFLTLRHFDFLRVSIEEEVMGLDKVTNGEVNAQGVDVNDAKVGGTRNLRMAMLSNSHKSRGSHETETSGSREQSGRISSI